MSLSSQKETYDSYTPSSPPNRTSTNAVLHHRSSKETIQSNQGSISNSSVHMNHTSTDEDLFGLSKQGPSVTSDDKSSHSEEKTTFGLRNQSRSTVCTIREPEPNRNYPASFAPRKESRSLSLSSVEDEAKSSLPSSPIDPLTPSPVNALPLSCPLDDGNSPQLDTMEMAITDRPSIGPASFFPRPTKERVGTTSRSRSSMVTVKHKKGILGFMTDFLHSKKRPKINTPHDPVSLTHVGLESSTSKSTGSPKDWQRLLLDSGTSKSDQQQNPLAVMETVKLYQEGSGDAPTPGSSQYSQSPPILGTMQADSGVSKSVDDSFVPTVSVFLVSHIRLLTIQSGCWCRPRKRLTLRQHYISLRSLYHSSRSLTLAS